MMVPKRPKTRAELGMRNAVAYTVAGVEGLSIIREVVAMVQPLASQMVGF